MAHQVDFDSANQIKFTNGKILIRWPINYAFTLPEEIQIYRQRERWKSDCL